MTFFHRVPLFFTALVAVHVFAEEQHQTPEALFKEHDIDGDGKLSFAEVVAMEELEMDLAEKKVVLEKLFKTADANADGQLAWEEEFMTYNTAWEKFLKDVAAAGSVEAIAEQQTPEGLFKEHDLDGDGKLSLAEVQAMEALETETPEKKAAVEEIFKSADKDGDGHLVFGEEFTAYNNAFEEYVKPFLSAAQPAEQVEQTTEELFTEHDLNKDSKLSMEEVMEMETKEMNTPELKKVVSHLFTAADKDKDQHLVWEEFVYYNAAFKAYASGDPAAQLEQTAEQLFVEHDLDKDEKLSLHEVMEMEELEEANTPEHKALVESLFKKADADSDGFLTFAEFTSYNDAYKAATSKAEL